MATDQATETLAGLEGMSLQLSLLDCSPVAHVILDETSRFHYLNPAYTRLLGYSLEEMSDFDVWWPQVCPDPVYRAWLREAWHNRLEESLTQGTPFRPLQGHLTGKDGAVRSLLGEVSLIPATEPRLLLVTLTDVTQHNRLQAQLEGTADRFKQAQKIAHMGSWELDFGTGQMHWSDEMFRLLELDPVQVEARYETFLARVHPQDRERVDQSYQQSLVIQENYQIDHRLLLPDGRIKHVQQQGSCTFDEHRQPLLSRGTVQDISERVEREQAVRDAEERFRRLFEYSPDPAWLIDRGHFVECNQAAVQMLGYADKSALTHTHPSALSPPFQPDGQPSRDKAERLMQATFEQGYQRFDWMHTRQDGSTFWAEVTLAAVDYCGRPMIYCTWPAPAHGGAAGGEREAFP